MEQIKCKYCKHKKTCRISKSDDWYCADAEGMTNTKSDEQLYEEIRKNLYEYLNTDHTDVYMPEECIHCSNHPSNGGSGLCNCILGAGRITC